MPLWLSLRSSQLEPSSTILDVKKLFAKQSEFSSSVYLCSLTLCIELCYVVDSVCMICFHRAQVLSWPAAVQSQQREKYVCNKVANELLTHLPLASTFLFPTSLSPSFPLHVSFPLFFPSSNFAEAKSLKDNVTLESLKIKDGGTLYFKDLGKLY